MLRRYETLGNKIEHILRETRIPGKDAFCASQDLIMQTADLASFSICFGATNYEKSKDEIVEFDGVVSLLVCLRLETITASHNLQSLKPA